MSRTGGAKILVAAGDDAFVTDAKPLLGVAKCKRGKTKLKVYLKRIDTSAAVANETVHAGLTSPGAAMKSAASTGLADYGVVKPGSYFFDVTLSGGATPKFKPYPTRESGVPVQMDFVATLKLVPIARLRIVLFDREGKKIDKAAWTLSDPVAANGTTGADGLIDVEVPWNAGSAVVEVKLPPGKLIAAPAPVAADPTGVPPPYPVTVRPEQWDPAPAKAPAPPAIVWTCEVSILPDADDDDGHTARLVNLGFPCTDAARTSRSVKAYQRLQKKEYAGSGVLADIKAHLKPLHDTV